MSNGVDGPSVRPNPDNGRLDCYLPRLVLGWLAATPADRAQTHEGTAVFLDTSGFTRLSERLARRGDEGAEILVDAINGCFASLLSDAYAYGGSLLKFSGDALLLWFEAEEHEVRACSAAWAMRSALRSASPDVNPANLRMSMAVHSGPYEMYLVGGSHREHVIAGPATTRLVTMEKAAAAGQILLSSDTAALLPARCVGSARGPGLLLARSPSGAGRHLMNERIKPTPEAVAGCLSTALRAYLVSGSINPEHRTATIAFLQFGGIDELIAAEGADTAADHLDELVRAVQEGADRYEVCILGSDIAADGGTLLLSAGAPRAVGDDEERMLLALAHAVEAKPRLPFRAGVNRGRVFTGEVGSPRRRTYAVMGDTTNLAARLAAAAPWRSIYAMPGVVKHSRTRFETTAVEPFVVKGKIRPVEPLRVGRARGIASNKAQDKPPPLVGRERELALLRASLIDASHGKGALVEVVGEVGSGKSRLLAEARALAGSMRFIHSTCQAYTQDVPYSAWREPLRHLLGAGPDEPGHIVLTRLRQELQRCDPDLIPWLPLLAIPFDVSAPSTTEADELAPEARTSKLHETVLRFLRRALEVPTLVQFEHVHRMDAASAALLGALSCELGSAAWLVLVTRRDVAGGFQVEAPHRRIELGPMPPSELLALAHLTPDAAELPPHVVELAVSRAAGSPEFLLDLLAAAAAGGPESLPASVEAAVTARIDALEPASRALVRRAAVLGLSFNPIRIADVIDRGTPLPSEQAWEQLSTVFARDDDGKLRFKRPALQQAAYASLPFKLRRALHAAVARSLERDLLRAPDADPALLSVHLMGAQDYARAYRYAMVGAERATERFSHADSAHLYQRAIEAARAGRLTSAPTDVKPPSYAWEELGNALRCTGEPEAATRALREARSLLVGDPVAQARLFHRQAEVCVDRESLSSAVRWVNRGLRCIDGLTDTDATRWRARLRSLLGGVRNRQGRWPEAIVLCRTAISEAESVGELEALAHASYALDWALVESGRLDEATHSPRALQIYEQLGDPEHESAVLNNLGMFAYFKGHWDQAIELYRRAGECSERAGKPGDVAATDCNVGEVLADQGRLAEARVHLERARRTWTATKERQGVVFVNLLLGRLAARDGRLDEAMPLLEQAAADGRRLGIDAYRGFARALIAEAEAFGGDPARALSITADELVAGGRQVPLLHRVRAIALARLGDLDAAADELRRSLAVARERGADYDTAATLDIVDALGLAQGDDLRERNAIFELLRIERLPKPQLPEAGRMEAATL